VLGRPCSESAGDTSVEAMLNQPPEHLWGPTSLKCCESDRKGLCEREKPTRAQSKQEVTTELGG
jgi:hypothetical protein